MSDRILKIWFHFKPIHIFTNHYQMEKKYVHNGMCAIGDEVLKEKELQYKSDSTDQQNDNDGMKKPQILRDKLLKMKEHFSMDQIKDELNTFLIAVR